MSIWAKEFFMAAARINERPTKREQQVLAMFADRPELTSGEVAHNFGISRQSAQNLLAGLVRKSLITKNGRTKKTYYQIS